MSFWGELRRRNVVKVAVAYAIMAWLLIQVADTLLPAFGAPAWVLPVFVLLLSMGFFVALFLSWAYELTPTGMVRTETVPLSQSVTKVTGRKFDVVIIGLLVLAVGFLVLDNYLPQDSEEIERQTLPNSVAVLPLDNLSPDPDNAYIAAGLHEEILNQLTKLSDLNVIARTSVLPYAENRPPIAEIAETLNVEAIMEGSIRYAGDRIRVTTQLIDSGTGAHLWSETYDRDFEDIFAIESDIAAQVANALAIEFSLEEQRAIERQPTDSLEAYTLYLRVNHLINTGNQSSQLLTFLDQALQRDPEFAQAHSAKAFVHAQLLINSPVGPAGDWEAHEALARASAEAALARDPYVQYAHTALANVELFRWRWTEARQIYENYYTQTRQFAGMFDWLSSWTGDHERARNISLNLIQLSPNEWGSHWHLGIASLYAGDFEAAINAFDNGILLAPQLAMQHSWRAWAFAARGEPNVALQALRRAEQTMGPNPPLLLLIDIAYAYGRIGERGDAERIFAEISGIANEQDIGAGGWAAVHLAVGDEQTALEWLEVGAEKALNQEPDPGFFTLMNLRMNVTGDPVLERPEFVDVRNRLRGD